MFYFFFFFFSSRRRHTRWPRDWSSDVCSSDLPIEARCARWLLNVADRVHRPTFALTHDFLAIMLGVRRASVSEAAADLQRSGAITYHRGIVTILDRALLESRSCECYRETKRVFADA